MKTVLLAITYLRTPQMFSNHTVELRGYIRWDKVDMVNPYHVLTEINDSIHAEDALPGPGSSRVSLGVLRSDYCTSAASFLGTLAAKLCGVI